MVGCAIATRFTGSGLSTISDFPMVRVIFSDTVAAIFMRAGPAADERAGKQMNKRMPARIDIEQSCV